MDRQQMPFLFRFLSDSELYAFKDGQIISTFNKCGLFFCRKGNVEVSLEDKHFQINPGDVYIYMASTLVHLLHKSEDAEGVMVEVDLDYIIPIVNRVINVENQLFMRKHPCISLSDKQRAHLEYLLDNLRERIEAEDVQEVNLQQQRLTLELIKSMGQTFCYEILNMYFANQPMQPLPQNKKDVIFQNFMLALFRLYRKERDVAYYARMQHITPRYFSTIIKEKSGNSALQWIVQMVITEAKQLQNKKDVIFQNFMLALFRLYRKERDVAYYARMQHITPRYFSTIIKEKSGNSALQWIVQMVITEAKQLLEGSDLSIKEIADQLNFPTQSFFGKYFKQYVGISPKEYRKGKLRIKDGI